MNRSLKEATADLHRRAESTELVKLIFNRSIDNRQYSCLLANQLIYYHAIEKCSESFCDKGLLRTTSLIQDLFELRCVGLTISPLSYDYADYISTLNNQQLWAHIYVHYLGDMMGGQMLKRCVPGRGKRFDFDNMPELISTIRMNISIADAHEANSAFEWTIRIYDDLYRRISTTS